MEPLRTRRKVKRAGRKGTDGVRRRQALTETIPPAASFAEIQATLLQAMRDVLEGRMSAEDCLRVGMVAEEQMEMLRQQRPSGAVRKGQDQFRRWVN